MPAVKEGASYPAGKYRSPTETILTMYKADAALVCITGGVSGNGYSVAVNDPALLRSLPHVLRSIADQIEADAKGTG
jgi:hypothetical protein